MQFTILTNLLKRLKKLDDTNQPAATLE